MEEYRKYDNDFDWWQLAVVVMFVLMGVGVLTSCKTKYVSVPEYHTTTVTKTDTTTVHDSVWVRDSIWVQMKNDTVYCYKYKTKVAYKDVLKVKTDTIWRHDSVTTIKPVERTLTKVEQRYINIGKWGVRIAIIVAVVLLLAVVVWLVKKKLIK